MTLPEGHLEGLDAPCPDADITASLSRRLRLGPWCWPDERRNASAAWMARELVPEGRPDARLGQVPLLTVSPTGASASVWVTGPSQPTCPGEFEATLGRRAQDAWENAWGALSRALPILWDSMERFRVPPRTAIRVGRLAGPGEAIESPGLVPDALDGGSFGLPFLLAMASQALQRPVPPDLAATGAIDDTGVIGPVGGVERKTEAVVRLCGNVRRILVAEHDYRDARRGAVRGNAPADFRVVRVRNAGQALFEAFGRNLADVCLQPGDRDEGERNRLVDKLYNLALHGRDAAVCWRPIEDAARLARTRWSSFLSPVQQERLSIAEGIAARHEGRVIETRMPSPALLDEIREEGPSQVIELVAQIVQQAADQASPDPADAEAWAREYLADIRKFDVHYMLMGALGRLMEVTGRLDEGLELEREASLAWVRLKRPQEMTRALSKWIWLAGSADRIASFHEARGVREKALDLPNGSDLARDLYVTLAICRGEILLGLPTDRTLAHLRNLVQRRDQEGNPQSKTPDHVKFSAARWLSRLARSLDHRDAARESRECLHGDPELLTDEARATQQDYQALEALDVAWPDLSLPGPGNPVPGAVPGPSADVEAALDVLRRHKPGRMRLLEAAAARDGVPAGLHVARFYPY